MNSQLGVLSNLSYNKDSEQLGIFPRLQILNRAHKKENVMNLWVRLYIKFKCTSVGCDAYGNTYHQEKKTSRDGQPTKRFVLFKGEEEASKVPALWHAWLHYTTNDVPTINVDSHLPNMTATPFAHTPTKTNARHQDDYSPWTPSN